MKSYFLFSLLVLLPLTACSESDSAIAQQEAEYQRQVDIYNEQTEITYKLQKETEKQLKETAKLQALSAKELELATANQMRLKKLIERQEKQADRYDAILDKWEKKQ